MGIRINKMAAAMAFSFVLQGCANLGERFSRPDATEYARSVTYAFKQPDVMNTSIGHALKEKIRNNPEKSGFRILAIGSHSLDARMALVQNADKTLDLQYYAMNDDVTSNLMVAAIIKAAERGVRVRFLIDDINTGEIKESLSALNSVENIEVRIFNPMTTQDQSLVSRVTGVLSNLSQANKRMHNKVLIADNLMAVTGGRNLGDEYFDYSAEKSFKDIDILAAGPITSDLSDNFDKFWNDDNSFPIETVYLTKSDGAYLEGLRKKLAKNWDNQSKNSKDPGTAGQNYLHKLGDKEGGLIWARAEVTADDPMKVQLPTDQTVSGPAKLMVNLVGDAEKEFVIISAYLVPKEQGVNWISDIRKRGVAVKILTNSLASTDVVAVHTGYRRYRKDLLRQGADLYEMKPVSDKTRQRVLGTGTPSHASLHSKAYIIDRKTTFIGSFNFDPRSVRLNTELALVIHSAEIAEQMYGMFERVTSPEYSYRLELDGENSLTWTTIKDGKTVVYRSEPDTSIWRDLQTSVFSLFPIEDLL